MNKYKTLDTGFEFEAEKIVGLFCDGLLLEDGTRIECSVRGVSVGSYWVKPGVIWNAEAVQKNSVKI